MKAYYPYARGLAVNDHLFYNLVTDECHDEIMENTAMFDNAYMMPTNSFTQITEQQQVLLYNPGTERAKVSIVISGTAGDGVTIANRTTKQSCRYIAFTPENGDICTDGINGKTITDLNGVQEIAFLYHDYGFIELEPAFPIMREVSVTYSQSTVTTTDTLYETEAQKEWYNDKYIHLGGSSGTWYQINQCTDEHTLSLKKPVSAAGSCQTNIVLMNEIIITPSQGTSISRLSFIYKPTYA